MEIEGDLRTAALNAGWSDAAPLQGQYPLPLTRLVDAISKLNIEDIDDLDEAIRPGVGAVEFLSDINDFALKEGFNAFAVPYDVALALILRAKGGNMELVEKPWQFGSEGLNIAVDYALKKERERELLQ